MEQHSKKYDEILDYAITGLWKKKRLKNAVTAGWITQEEYDEIISKVEAEKEETTK